MAATGRALARGRFFNLKPRIQTVDQCRAFVGPTLAAFYKIVGPTEACVFDEVSRGESFTVKFISDGSL